MKLKPLSPLSSRVYMPTKTKIKRSRSRRDLDLGVIRESLLKLLEEEAGRRRFIKPRFYPALD